MKLIAYHYQEELLRIWEHGVSLYQQGERKPVGMFDAAATDFLRENGATAQEVFDFVEDFVVGGEPDFTTFAMITDIRRSFFLIQQNSHHSKRVIEDSELPPKSESVRGIVWLPRIIVKAKAKLRGEMNPNLMYGCGGDRNFFKENNLHPAEFLRLVADHLDNDEAVIEYVVKRSGKTGS